MIRNHNGSILYAESFTFPSADALQAETVAIKEACIFIIKANLENAIFETDCLNAILYITDENSFLASPARC